MRGRSDEVRHLVPMSAESTYDQYRRVGSGGCNRLLLMRDALCATAAYLRSLHCHPLDTYHFSSGPEVGDRANVSTWHHSAHLLGGAPLPDLTFRRASEPHDLDSGSGEPTPHEQRLRERLRWYAGLLPEYSAILLLLPPPSDRMRDYQHGRTLSFRRSTAIVPIRG
jgi:hypothetical protein